MPRLDHFGLIAPFYDRIFGGLDTTRLVGLLGLPAGRLLDVGGGTGRVAGLLAGEAGFFVVVDPSAGMLRRARSKAGLFAALGRAERLPFPDCSFERVLVVDAFHHFAHHAQAASELMRVLAPGGRLVIQELNIERLPVKAIALGERMLLIDSHFHSPKSLRRLFALHGGRVTIDPDDPINFWVIVERAAKK